MQEIITMPVEGHERDDGLFFKPCGCGYELQPCARFSQIDRFVNIKEAEQVIRAVCESCPAFASCMPEIRRISYLFGLIKGGSPNDLIIVRSHVLPHCRLDGNFIPDCQFRR